LTGEHSGGQRQSLLLDVFTASSKRVAILDEPLSQLDQLEVTRQIARVISSASSILILTPTTHHPEQ
jgi:ABC-type bacteriocin/lantibiotic exporter with double-glycine peptidase domain